jgi:hypothetical protein
VRWAYNQIRIGKLKKEEGFSSNSDLEKAINQPINPEKELREQEQSGKPTTRYDRLLSL